MASHLRGAISGVPRRTYRFCSSVAPLQFQITRVSMVCSFLWSGADQRKHRNFASLACVRWPVTIGFPHKGSVTRNMLPFDDAIIKFLFSWLALKFVSRLWTFVKSTYRKYSLQGPDSTQRRRLTSIGNPIVEIRRSYDRLMSTMRFPIVVRRHLYIESGPWALCLLKDGLIT